LQRHVALLDLDKLREIVKNPLFEQNLAQLEFDAVRADEFTEGAEFVLSRNPEYGTKITKNVWFLPMWRPSEGKNVNLYYTFNADQVHFLALQRASEEI
jgi:hypothetical protein